MEQPFYSDGLRFSCTRCSACCTGEPGFVFLSKDDVKRLLSILDLDFSTFFRDYCRLVDVGTGNSLSLREKELPRTGKASQSCDCILWSDRGCTAYEGRPIQCSTYPFWSTIVESPASWKDEALFCPGIGSGTLWSKSYIEEALYNRRKAGCLVFAYDLDPGSLDADTILGS